MILVALSSELTDKKKKKKKKKKWQEPAVNSSGGLYPRMKTYTNQCLTDTLKLYLTNNSYDSLY